MTSISKTVYPDILDDTVNKYDSTYYRTTKMKPVDVKPSIYINFNMIKKIIRNALNLKLVII